MARIRCGNMEEVSRFWIADKKIKCIFCVVRDGALRRYIEGGGELRKMMGNLKRVREGRDKVVMRSNGRRNWRARRENRDKFIRRSVEIKKLKLIS